MTRWFRYGLATMLALLVLALPAQALAAVKIHKIYFDSPGADGGSNASLNAEYIVIRNTGSARVGIGGWTIRDTSGHVFRFPAGFRIGAGSKVTVHTGSGSNTLHHRYWSQNNYVWNNDGDTARMRRANGTLADQCSYSGAGSYVFC
jgi:lamin tail-like protein